MGNKLSSNSIKQQIHRTERILSQISQLINIHIKINIKINIKIINMITTYFISIRTQTNEHHAVHREGCPFMPDDGKRIFLGDFISSRDALSAGKKHFKNSDICRFCSGEHHSVDHSLALEQSSIPLNIMSLKKFSACLENVMLCCVN